MLYLLAMPLYTFILPIYSFWKMDDFSCKGYLEMNLIYHIGGSTRLVQEDDDSDVFLEIGDREVAEEGYFNESCIPKKTWQQFEFCETASFKSKTKIF